jgi:plasmid stabilization system protein ParE
MPTRYAVNLTRAAKQDIEETWNFIAEDSNELATKFIKRLEAQIASLERFPERCPLIAENELMHTRYRHIVFGKYRTVFRISGRSVYIMRVIRSARLLDASVFESADLD